MAETYSAEFTSLWITKPPGKVNWYGYEIRYMPVTYPQVLDGDIGDTVVLARLPACTTLLLASSVLAYSGFTQNCTLSLGWKAYTDNDGVIQAASAAGLFNGLDISDASGLLHGGLAVEATPDDALPVVTAGVKWFNNRTPVDLYATIGVAVPGATADLTGYFAYLSMG